MMFQVPGNRGYRYFGAAKDLPGVRELFEREIPLPPRKTHAEFMKDIDADYYGYRDDDDGLLVPLEKEAEEEARRKAIAEWEAKKGAQASAKDDSEEETETDKKEITQQVIPSQEDIQKALLERRKKDLIEKYL